MLNNAAALCIALAQAEANDANVKTAGNGRKLKQQLIGMAMVKCRPIDHLRISL